jgi:hypothetical protein
MVIKLKGLNSNKEKYKNIKMQVLAVNFGVKMVNLTL